MFAIGPPGAFVRERHGILVLLPNAVLLATALLEKIPLLAPVAVPLIHLAHPRLALSLQLGHLVNVLALQPLDPLFS